MTREEARKAAEVMMAYANGEEIEYKNCGASKWKSCNPLCNEALDFNWLIFKYRIKPKLAYRPFKDKNECWQEMHRHPDFGWIIYNKKYYSICDVTNNEITILYECDSYCFDFKLCIEEITFTDGAPFGIK